MGSGDDDSVRTNYNGQVIGRMYRNHDLNQNTTNVKPSVLLSEMTNRQDGKSPCKEITSWKLNTLASPHGKTSPNSNLHFKNGFFTEDSCSNDFFYDEEFTIPFDANLTDQRDSDEGFLPRLGIVTSKSDNCLYLGDADHLGSDREDSGSDREIFSSSDSSELFNQPLFSSHSECPDEFALDASGDEASIIEDDLPKDVHKLNHIKHHYKISFDKGPLKVWSSSDEPASKTSLELRPSNRVANKPTTLGLQKNGEKAANSSSACHKSGNGTRKSKKKSSQKNGTPRNSKSSHLVTWGTLKDSPSTSESGKSRTTWKEMNNKPSLSAREEEEGRNRTENPAKSHESNAEERSKKNGKHPDADELEEIQSGSVRSNPQMGEKTCELFKIFQVKKLKEAEECVDEFDESESTKPPHEPLGPCDEATPPGKEEDCTSKCNFPDLQDIFDGTKKSKSEKKLKFKSHSIEPSNSSPTQDPEKSPKIVQSANLASTTSTDSSVQTSLIISIPVKTENKSLQTSLTFAEEKQPETSGRDIWNTSSYLFSRPLPDLSFLKNSSKFMESKVEAAPTKQPKSAAKEEAKAGKKSNPQSQNKSTFKQTFVKSKALSNSKTSQESSGRSKSSSSFSFNSSSSSGIDPGTSDSGRQSSSASSKDESLHSDLSKTPPKPPRLFKAANPGEAKDGPPAKEDGTSKIVENVKEPNPKTSSEARNARNFTRGNHPTRRSPSLQDKVDLTQNRGSKVILRSNNNQPGYAQPTKSILVRSRSKENRRSWSNNFQTGSTDSHVSAERASPRKRPLSVPDGTLLELATPMQEEEKPLGDDVVPSKGSEVDPHVATVADDKDKSHSKEEGTNNGGATAAGDHDYEKFRAKKSVSFSETISYHPTTSSLSPLESPKSPVNSVPASPDADPARDVPKCTPDSTQDTTEDVELPPNDFLVSPNISPASSLSDSSSNLHPLNFDLQQKKDLVMDVVKAVEVIFRHVGRCKDPLAKAKLCSTVDNPKIGNLLLEHLCPSIHAIVLDGIKPNIPGLFGRTKSSACKVFEDSLEGSPFDSLNHLMKSMKDLKFLSNPWLKFNAYLFALLNLKVLDMWLASLRKNRPVLARYYNPTSFLQLGSSSAGQSLFLDVVAALQPLSQMQFRLEYDFEVNVVERKRQAFIAEQLLNKHISRSGEVHAETESYLSRMYSTFSLDSPVARVPKHPATSLCFEEKPCEATKNQEVVDENSEPSIFLLWSSVDFGGLARGILQKTQNKLIEKLSQSRDMFSFDASNSSGRSCKQQNCGSLSESSMQQKPPGQSLDSSASPDSPMPQMSRSECPRACPEFNGSPCGDAEQTSNTTNNNKTGNVVVHNQKQTPPPIPKIDLPNPISNLTSPPIGLKPSAMPQKPQGSLLSSYGTKIVGVFDRLLLKENPDKVDGDLFVIRKKYHSEDQISRHVMDSPKNGLLKQEGPILAKSVSCESDKGHRSNVRCDGRATMLASSSSSRLRVARSLCHYVAMNNQFLSFEKEVEMSVVKEVGHDFFLCRLKGQEGLVYKVCVSVVC